MTATDVIITHRNRPVKTDKDDPLLKEWALMVRSRQSLSDLHWAITLFESLMVPSMSAETEDGEMVVIRGIPTKKKIWQDIVLIRIPEGTAL